MKSYIDTNILLDVILDDPIYGKTSRNLLAHHLDVGSLWICETVYAELVPQYDNQQELESDLFKSRIELDCSNNQIAYFAGLKWSEYRRAGGSRQRVLPDFFVGAHAYLKGDCLLTRDRGFYKTYFPELKVVHP